METKRKEFLGTYFNKDIVLRLAGAAKVFSWIVAVFYVVQFFIQVGIFILQFTRGFWAGLGFTDLVQTILVFLEQPLRGLVYFVVLQGVAQALLMFMDMEENTRRAARN